MTRRSVHESSVDRNVHVGPFNRRAFISSTATGMASLAIGKARAGDEPANKTSQKGGQFNHYNDGILVAGEPPSIESGSITIAVLPDTQKYAKVNPKGFLEQTNWILKNHQKRNIVCALHLGDITDNNEPKQWELAVQSMKKLDGHVPYFMSLGNHDYSNNGVCADRTTLFNEYFPLATYSQVPTFGGVYDQEPDRLENSYHLITAGGREMLFLCLEFGPRKDVVRWANEVVSKHSKRAVILVTHAYMYFDDTRFDRTRYGTKQSWNPHSYKVADATGDDIHDGEELWDQLVSRHPNFIMTLNGHVLNDGLGRLTSQAANRHIHQMLVNFQNRPKGGDSFMRLIEVKVNGSADICDYAPQRNERNESSQNKFSLQLSPVG